MPDIVRAQLHRRIICGVVVLACCLGLPLWVHPVSAGMPVVNRVDVADVTPRSFSVYWQSSEPATPSVNLFQADCVTPIADPVLAAQGSDRTGILKVTVSGLDADTSYCYQSVSVSRSTAETAFYPASPAPVRTEKAVLRTAASGGASVPFGNDVLRAPAPYLRPATAETQEGLLVILDLLDGKGDRPLSLLLGADETMNYFDMNNVFSPATGQSADLSGLERVRVTELHGNAGCSSIVRFRLVPADAGITTARDLQRGSVPADIDCNGSVNILDIIRVAHAKGSQNGDVCYNSDLDMNADGRVDLLDVEAVIGGFSETL